MNAEDRVRELLRGDVEEWPRAEWQVVRRRARRGRAIGAASVALFVAGVAWLALAISGGRHAGQPHGFVGPAGEPTSCVDCSSAEPSSPPEPTPLAEAPRVYQDRFAGFQIEPPRGWIMSDFFGFYSLAPSVAALDSWPEHHAYGKHGMFTMYLQAGQRLSLAQVVAEQKRQQREEPPKGSSVDERRATVAGRAANIITVDHPVDASINCSGCHFEYWAIDWSNETVIRITLLVGSEDVLKQYGGAAYEMINSLAVGPTDPLASALRSFLNARAAGSGAEEWLSPEAARQYEVAGLYAVGEQADPKDIDIASYSVAGVQRLDDRRTAFDVWVAGSQLERVVLRSTTDPEGATQVVVSSMNVTAYPGVS